MTCSQQDFRHSFVNSEQWYSCREALLKRHGKAGLMQQSISYITFQKGNTWSQVRFKVWSSGIYECNPIRFWIDGYSEPVVFHQHQKQESSSESSRRNACHQHLERKYSKYNILMRQWRQDEERNLLMLIFPQKGILTKVIEMKILPLYKSK